jgi:hypothetical protein
MDADGADPEGIAGQGTQSPGDANGINWLIGASSQCKKAGAEGADFAGFGSGSFGEDANEKSLVQLCQRCADAAGAGCFAADWNHKCISQQGSQQWDAKEIIASEVANRTWQPDSGDEGIEEGLVVEQQQAPGLKIQMFSAGNADSQPCAAEDPKQKSQADPDAIAFQRWLCRGR